jgi:hypothetical protein
VRISRKGFGIKRDRPDARPFALVADVAVILLVALLLVGLWIDTYGTTL